VGHGGLWDWEWDWEFLKSSTLLLVIPAQAGIHLAFVPAFACVKQKQRQNGSQLALG
jgi:hypothetical protein